MSALNDLAASGSPDHAVAAGPNLPSSFTTHAASRPAGQQARHEAFMQSVVSSESLDADITKLVGRTWKSVDRVVDQASVYAHGWYRPAPCRVVTQVLG